MIHEKSCGAIVFNDEKVLVVKHNAGHIDFPKGHMEENETEIDTAIREVKEETGIDIEINSKYRYTIYYSPKPEVSKEVVFFLAKDIGGKIKPQYTEVEAVYYIEKDKVIDTLTYDNSKDIFKKLLKEIKKD